MATKKTKAPAKQEPTPTPPPVSTGPDPTTEARLAVLEEELVAKDEQIADLNAIVAKLSKTAEKQPSPVSNLKPLKRGKKLYKFAFAATFFEGKKITAEEVSDNLDLADKLIEAGSGMLVEQ